MTHGCIYIDDVPVLFTDPEEPDRLVIEALAPLGGRVRWGHWEGEYPLTDALLEQSMDLCDDVVSPLLRAAGWDV